MDAVDRSGKVFDHCLKILEGAVGKILIPDVVPEVFRRIELRAIWR